MSDSGWFKQQEFRRACGPVRAAALEKMIKGLITYADVVIILRKEYARLARMYR